MASRKRKPDISQPEEDDARPASDHHSFASASNRSSDDETDISEQDQAPKAGEDEAPLQDQLRTISFGALAEAQSSLPSQRRQRQTTSSTSTSDKLSLLRERLAELQSLKSRGKKRPRERDSSPPTSARPASPKRGRRDDAAPPPTRTHKHAPSAQSSKRPVPRVRPAITVAKDPYHSRDPRFSALSGAVQEQKVERDYAFLDDYRAEELAALKEAQRRAKAPQEKEQLRREVEVLENQARAKREKERAKEVVRKHRREERERVGSGKKPFYLKRGEVKRRAEEERWGEMKAKERDKATKRKRTREGQKEKRKMPGERRVTG